MSSSRPLLLKGLFCVSVHRLKLPILLLFAALSQGFAQVPTLSSMPAVSQVRSYTAVASGEVLTGTSLSEVGFVWSTVNALPTTSDNKVVVSGLVSTGTYQVLLSNLPANSTIYLRSYATNGDGTGYSSAAASFTTRINISYDIDQNAINVVGQPDFTSSTSGLSSQNFNASEDVAIDLLNGKMYVADKLNNRVLRFTYPIISDNPVAEAVFGQTDFVSNTAATSATGLDAPTGVFVDNAGRLWVADNGNRRVVWYNNAYTANNGAAADGVLGQPDFVTKSASTSQNKFRGATRVIVDEDGRLWVAERGSHRVLRFDNAALKANGANADGVLGQTNFTDRTSGLSSSSFNSPWGISVHGGTLWVADVNNNRVLRFDNAASKANGSPADGVLGQSDFVSNSAALSQSGMNRPTTCTVDPNGTLWVADRQNRRITGFANAQSKSDGADADYLIGAPNFTTSVSNVTAENRVRSPFGLAIDPSNMLLATAIQTDNRVTIFNLASLNISTPVANNIKAFSANLGATLSSGYPVSEVGIVWSATNSTPTVADNKVISTGNTAPGIYSVFVANLPAATTIYYRGYVISGSSTEYTNVDNFTTSSSPAFTFTNGQSAVHVLGQPNFNSSASGTSSQDFNVSRGIAIDQLNNKVYVSDAENNRVLRFSYPISNYATAEAVFGQSNFTSSASGTSATSMNRPFGIAVDNTGRLWVCESDNNRVIWFDNAHLAVSGTAANGVLGQPDFTSNTPGTSATTMNTPRDIAIDRLGNLYVVDYLNNRILRYDNASSKSNGASADGVLGQSDFVSSGTGTTASTLNKPSGICVSDLNIWVADYSNNRVLRYDNAASKPDGGSADVVLGQVDFTTATSGLSNTKFNLPMDCDVDGFGNLWVVDRNNNRILGFANQNTITNGVAATYVCGQAGFSTKTSGATSSSLNSPRSIAVNNAGYSFLVADAANNRILEFSLNSNLLPTVSSPTSTGIDSYCAILGGDVTTGINLAEVGIVWSTTNSMPTVANSNKVVASGVKTTGVFSAFVCDLTPGQKIYFRAYATNFAGTGYSVVDSFTTASAIAYQKEDSAKFVVGQTDFLTTSSTVTSKTFAAGRGVAIDARNGKLYVADFTGNRILRFAYPVVSNFPEAEIVFGQDDFTSSEESSEDGGLNKPYGLFVDNTGRLWVSEVGNNRVTWFNNAHLISSNKPTPNGLLGQPNFATTNGGTTGSKLKSPRDIIIDDSGNLWVADAANNRVVMYVAPVSKPAGASADKVLGQSTFTSSTSGSTATTMSSPMGLAYYNGTLWVSDRNNNRVLRFDNAASKANGSSADGVLGQSDFTSTSANLTASGMNQPLDCTIDPKGTLWVADSKHRRAIGFENAQGKANGAVADHVIGQANFTSVGFSLRPNRQREATALAFDPLAFDLAVSDGDGSGNRVLIFDLNDPFGTRQEANVDAQGMRTLVAYPNPSAGYVKFDFKTTEDEVVTMAIYDLTGKQIATLTGVEDLNRGIQIQAKGIYFAKLMTNSGISQTVKFVIE